MPMGLVGNYRVVTDGPLGWTVPGLADAMDSMKRLATLLLLASAALVACGDDDSGGSSGERAKTTSASAPAEQGEPVATEPAEPAARLRGPLVRLRDSQFGPVLFDGRDRALYLFTRDPKSRTRCYGACAAAWPPFFARARPRAGRGVDADLLGTIRRRDGRRQVTYKGQALYFYIDDPRGQVLCNDIVEFGGTWYALTAKGNPPV
jgi:predicted lipoprotein with Yx(FWY)xxD motif